uniref:Uncharacterized protein n=1 Tax=Sphaerodactylus townsendi TaxID=933632 RepID=A0ACB8FG08_9SAUR
MQPPVSGHSIYFLGFAFVLAAGSPPIHSARCTEEAGGGKSARSALLPSQVNAFHLLSRKHDAAAPF